MNDETYEVLYERAYHLLARRWVTHILLRLMECPHGFNELRRTIPEISLNMLNDRLRELVATGLVERGVQIGPPLRTIYALTPAGDGLRPVAQAMCSWNEGLSPETAARLVATSRGLGKNAAVNVPAAGDRRQRPPLSSHAFRLLGRRWAMSILRRLLASPVGFNELRRAIPAIPERVMVTRLHELVAAGLVERQVQSGSPRRVLYTLTPSGERLRVATETVTTWLESLSEYETDQLLAGDREPRMAAAGVAAAVNT